MIRKFFTLGLGATALTPVTALAQDSLLLDEIIASATLVPTEVSRTGATVETLDREDIDSGGQSLSETLSRVPGVTFSANGGLGKTSSLRIRGLSDSYVGVRIDGMDFTDPSKPDVSLNFGTLTPGLADRIEIAKGPQSALYGANAIAGVVDITTWRPEALGFSGRASVEAGSYHTYSGTLNLGYASERGEVAMTLSHLATDGFSAQTGNDEDDGFEQTLLTLSAAYDLTDDVRLGFSALYSDGTSDYDGSATDADPDTKEDETRKGLRLFTEITGDTVNHEVSVAWTETERAYRSDFGTYPYDGQRTRVSYLGSTDLSAATTLAFGAEWTEEKAKFSNGRKETESAAIFGEVQYAPSADIDLSLAMRYDDYSDYDGQMTGRAALAWRPQQDLIVRAVLGTGYRTPSLAQLFGPFGANPDLTPEKSRSAELGIEKLYGEDSFAKATLFYSEIEDLIQYDGSYVQNPGTSRYKGIELSGRYAFDERFALFGNYTYTDATGPDGRLIRVPRHDVNLGLDAELADKWHGTVSLQHVADQLDNGTELDDYTVVNAGVRYAVTDTAEAYLRVENLFDEAYESVNGYNMSDRAVYVGLRASF